MEVSDKEIVSELKSSKSTGPRLLKDKYSEYLQKAAYKILSDDQDAWTVVNDTLLQAVNKIETFNYRKSENDFRNWLVTICVRKAIDLLRKRKRDEAVIELSLDDEKSFGKKRNKEKLLVENENGLDQNENSESKKNVREFLNNQSERDRRILEYCSEGLPHKDIAEMLGIPPQNVRVYYSRLLKKLETFLSSKASKA